MNLKIFLNKKILSFAVLCLSFFVFAPNALAICCKCVPQNMDSPPTSCVTVATLQDPLNCTTLPDEQKMTGFTCEKTPLTEAQCKNSATSGGGVCTGDPQPAKATRVGTTITSEPVSDTKAASSLLPTALQLNTPIPGFQAPKDMGLLFASYIIAIYRYMISIAVFVTTVMFIWGAFRYLVGSSMGSVSRGKEIMKDSVIGLLLVLSANLILRTINPQLVSLPNLDLAEIQSKLWQPVETAFNVSIGSRTALKIAAIQQAKATGIPELPCMAKATIDRESGGNIGAINHNEDFNSTAYSVVSRQKYLTSGGGGKFAPIPCSDASCQVQSVPKNGDRLDLNSPPNYGLDLQYSHALGAAQAAIFPNDKPCPGKETLGPGHRESTPQGAICLTIPELMTADGAAAVIIAQNVRNLKSTPNNIAQALGRYVGNINGDHPESQARYAIFTACMRNGIDSYPDYNGSMLSGASGGKSSGGGGLVLGNGIKVLLIGDSLAHGMDPYLRNLIQSRGADYASVYQDGTMISAYVGNGKKAAALDAALASSPKPNYVLVSLGTNDEYVVPAQAKTTSNITNAKNAYDALIAKLNKAGVTTYWILPPALPDKYDGGGTIRVNGDAVEDILRQTSAYFDSEQISLPRPANEIHPDGKGYKIWAQAVFDWMTK